MRFFALLLLASLMIGCSDSEDTKNDDQTNIRFFNAVPNVRSVDFLIDADPVFPATGFLEGSGYVEMDTDRHDYDAIVTGTFTSLGSRSTRLRDDVDFTFMVIGRSSEARVLFLQDDNEPASDDLVKMRAIHAATAVRAVDIFVVEADDTTPDGAASLDNVGFGSVSSYRVSRGGLYNIIVTESTSRKVLARLNRTPLDARNVYTIVVADSPPGRQPLQIVVLQDTQN